MLIGTINKIQGATSLDDCKPCSAGHYCVGPAATGETGKVAGGHYSMSGAMSAIPVPGNVTGFSVLCFRRAHVSV